MKRGVCFQGCLFSIFLFLGSDRKDDDLPLPPAVGCIRFELLGAVWLEQGPDKQAEGWERPGSYLWKASQLLLSHIRRYHRGWRSTRPMTALWGRGMPKGKTALRELLLQQGNSWGHSRLVSVYPRIFQVPVATEEWI